MSFNLLFSLGLGVSAVLSALGSLLLVSGLRARKPAAVDSVFLSNTRETVFLFDGETLIDCTAGARAILSTSHAPGGAWTKLMAYFGPTFPDLAEQLKRLPTEGVVSLFADDADGLPLLLTAEQRGGLIRIVIEDAESPRTGHSDPMIHRAMSRELDFQRTILSRAPMLIWQERENSDVIWANASYILMADKSLPPGQDLTWPLPRIFDKIASSQGAERQRQRVVFQDQTEKWFDLYSHPIGDKRLVFAISADSVVTAESTLRDFMQTLTKTFAHLPIALAIFDRQRQLQLFNPALVDLTGLPPDFLSQRPSLKSLLDAMRENHILPEPKDYRGWRRHLIDLERGAASGLHEELWTLPTGQTYRVIGRPHPNGALALMIEDISTEVSRSRRYRADLELGQAVIDAMDEAVAVFSESGNLVMTNAAYSALWGHQPTQDLSVGSVRSLSEFWKAVSAPTKLWSEIEDYVATVGDRESWKSEVRLLDGRLIGCRMHPLTGGATLIGFQVDQGPSRAIEFAPADRRQA